jgi:hypothetical protein
MGVSCRKSDKNGLSLEYFRGAYILWERLCIPGRDTSGDLRSIFSLTGSTLELCSDSVIELCMNPSTADCQCLVGGIQLYRMAYQYVIRYS